MSKRVTIIQGHPDRHGDHLDHALAAAYAQGASEAGHAVELITVATLDFPLLRTAADFEHGMLPPPIADCQKKIASADHLVIIYPLWLGDVPALLKGFLEQTFRPGFAFTYGGPFGAKKLLKGKTCRLILTMGMPAFVYRWIFRSHSVKSMQRNMLAFCGIKPVGATIFGGVERAKERRRDKWLAHVRELGRKAQ
ncbi:MAG TPA: NAD(P)H-dependent oxidoreductase [Candidatus Binatia bacterium]|nr:NAD(P)H-dependent oxidoreductase [Candidatus Binatia bacterium]